MSSASGKHSEHRMSQKTEAARVVAKLLSKRHTSISEIPDLIENVERALQALDSNAGKSIRKGPEAVAMKAAPEPRVKRASDPRKRRDTHVVAPLAEKAAPGEKAAMPEKPAAEPQEIKPVQPTLLRRAAVTHVAPTAPPPAAPTPTNGIVRGVVQWFDTRTARGTLRLQGVSSDLPIDGDTLIAAGLTRLFKGQEIEATLEGGEEMPKIAALRLLNLSPNSPVMGGTVRDRHAKQVVVELKREALSRTAARAEAELLLPSRRAR
jgi:cold shock CspA family protein